MFAHRFQLQDKEHGEQMIVHPTLLTIYVNFSEISNRLQTAGLSHNQV